MQTLVDGGERLSKEFPQGQSTKWGQGLWGAINPSNVNIITGLGMRIYLSSQIFIIKVVNITHVPNTSLTDPRLRQCETVADGP